MIKTQIQLPDELYHRAKAFAKTREWSLAETFRRAAEDMFETYPHHPDSLKEWSFPEPRNLGWKPMDAREMHRVAMDDMEPQLP
jgi:hypothetical protein